MFCPNPDCDARRRNSAASCATWKNSGELLVSQLLQQVLQPLHTFFRIRNEAIKSLCSAVRRFRDSTIEDVKATISTLFKTSWKALAWADDLIQN
jgi:hypothetical protein